MSAAPAVIICKNIGLADLIAYNYTRKFPFKQRKISFDETESQITLILDIIHIEKNLKFATVLFDKALILASHLRNNN